MAGDLKVVCPQCGAANRIDSARLGDRPKCGRCKQLLFNSYPLELSNENFDRNISANEIPVVVEFWAPWCGYCKRMAPIFDQAAAQLEPRVRFAKVNTEAEPSISGRFGVQGVPTTIIFKNGREIARQSGAMDLPTLLRWISSFA
ncbi:MAG TPA: thioredoxin TrxC [Thermodesulfobacteriota bacterium]|nr:thioredoxin TrxC [Thermodesulfobacteriota bacterium]